MKKTVKKLCLVILLAGVALCAVSLVGCSGKSGDSRSNPIKLNEGSFTAKITGKEKGYDIDGWHYSGLWYKFTPTHSCEYVVKSTAQTSVSFVLMFDSSDYEPKDRSVYFASKNECFRFGTDLIKGDSYYFFIGMFAAPKGEVEFDIFAAISPSELYRTIIYDQQSAVKAAVELVDLARSGDLDAEDMAKNMDPAQFIPLAEDGSADAAFILAGLADCKNAAAKTALQELNTDAFILAAEGGSLDAVYAMLRIRSYNTRLIEALLSFNVDAIRKLADDGSYVAFSILTEIYHCGNLGAKDAINSLKLDAFVKYASEGKGWALSVFSELERRYDNPDFAAAVNKISLKVYVKGLENRRFDFYSVLMMIYQWGNESVADALKSVKISNYVKPSAEGSMEDLTVLIGLGYAENQPAVNALKKLDFDAYIPAIEDRDLTAITMLSIAIDLGSETALAALQKVNVDALIVLAEEGDYRARLTITYLADFNDRAADYLAT